MTNDVEATKRANVERLNNAAMNHYKKEELTVKQEMFISLLKGDEKEIEDKLYNIYFTNEYLMAHRSGEPDLEHILAVKLLEKLRGQKMYMSIIYQEAYLEHIFKKGKCDVKGK